MAGFVWGGLRATRLIAACLPTLILFGFEWIEFGSIIPHAALAKPVAYAFPLSLSALDALTLGFEPTAIYWTVPLLLIYLASLIRIITTRLKLEANDAFLLFSAGIFFAWVAGRTPIFGWYFCLLGFAFGLSLLLSLEHCKINRSFSRLAEILICLHVVTGFALLGQKLLLDSFISTIDQIPENARSTRYRDIGTGLYSMCPNCRLVTSEIGGLGYGFKGHVLDAFGLADPEAVNFHPMPVPSQRAHFIVGAIPPGYVVLHQPEFIVSMPVFSAALRASNLLVAYGRYDCQIGTNRYQKIFGDMAIEIYSLLPISDGTLKKMDCHRDIVEPVTQTDSNALHEAAPPNRFVVRLRDAVD